MQWTMTIAGFLLAAGIIFWEVFLLFSGLTTTMIYNWPLLVIGVILFMGGFSCFLTKPEAVAEPHRHFGDSPRDF